MACEQLNALPLYPGERMTRRPTAEQVLRLFSLVQRSRLYRNGREVQLFPPELTELQLEILDLLNVPRGAYR
jgi:hypothetical protein